MAGRIRKLVIKDIAESRGCSFAVARTIYANKSIKEKQRLCDRMQEKIAAKAPASGADETSFASRAIDAMLDHAMGGHNPDYDWLVEPYL